MSTETKQSWDEPLTPQETDVLANRLKAVEDAENEARRQKERKEQIHQWWEEHCRKRKEGKERDDADYKTFWAKETERQEAAKKRDENANRWFTGVKWFAGASLVAGGAFLVARGANHNPPAPPEWKNDWIGNVVVGVAAVGSGIFFALAPV